VTLFDDLTWRGLIAHCTDPDALKRDLDEGQITFYVGFDPTAPSLHMGNLLQLVLARRLQMAGHRPILLVGGSTGLIGDPRQSAERALNPTELVHAWGERIHAQVSRFVEFEGSNAALVVNNYDWTAPLGTLDFLRDIGKHFSVNRMLDRDIVRNRLESGISYTEFSYVLLQSLDYLELHKRYGATLQTGGSDQWGNITAGVELIRRVTGNRVHALTTPLITKADGSKYGKTETGSLWLSADMMSPYAFHQFFLNVEDAGAGTFLRMFTFRSHEEIEDLERQTVENPGARTAQRALAADLTDLVHSVGEREAAEAAARAVFGQGDLAGLDAATLAAVVQELPHVRWDTLAGRTVIDGLTESGVCESRAAAKRALAEGGAYLNNQRVTTDQALAETDRLPGGILLFRRGKKTLGAVQVG